MPNTMNRTIGVMIHPEYPTDNTGCRLITHYNFSRNTRSDQLTRYCSRRRYIGQFRLTLETCIQICARCGVGDCNLCSIDSQHPLSWRSSHGALVLLESLPLLLLLPLQFRQQLSLSHYWIYPTKLWTLGWPGFYDHPSLPFMVSAYIGIFLYPYWLFIIVIISSWTTSMEHFRGIENQVFLIRLPMA